MVSRSNYSEIDRRAVRSVVLELHQILAGFAEHMVIIGGLVPGLLIENREQHVGTLDVDVAFDHRHLTEQSYSSIRERLLSAGYRETKNTFSFVRTVHIDGERRDIVVDVLAGQYGGTGNQVFHQYFQEISALKIRGCDLVFANSVEVGISGQLPNGATARYTVKVASIVAFLILKGNALVGRAKDKDAYDVYYCLCNFEGGIDAIGRAFSAVADNRLVQEGLKGLASSFESMNAPGPVSVADFEEIVEDEDERERIKRDAFERVQSLLRGIGYREPVSK